MTNYLVFVGTYTGGQSQGIYILQMDPADGTLERRGVVPGVVNPSFLAIHPNGKYLYAVNEIGDYEGKPSGAVTAFAIDTEMPTLRKINQRPTGGGAPCHLVIDSSGKNVLFANYTGGSVGVLRIEPDGSLGETTAFVQHEGSSVNKDRQEGPHAHSINLDASNRFAFAADLGLDKMLVYRFDAEKGSLEPAAPPSAALKPGAGPRHFAFHPKAAYGYAINELDSTITVFAHDAAAGSLNEVQTISTLPSDFEGTSWTAEVVVHPTGRFVYGSNRGHDSIAVFAVDDASGKLTMVECESTGGKTPRNFNIEPTGRFLLAANQGSENVVVFRIDPKTGALERSGEPTLVPTPVCIRFLSL